MIKILPCAVVMILGVSCSNGLLGDMERVVKDPVVSPPEVSSFENGNFLSVAWAQDPGADEYLLYRSADTPSPVYSLVYRGTELSYKDTDVQTGGTGGRYLYTLTKARGTNLFGPSDPVLGVVSGVIPDSSENNDTREKAAELVWDLQSNLYYYRSYSGEELIDHDWYRITVPPRRKAIVVITQNGLNGGESSWMSFALQEHVPETVVSGNSIGINNYSYSEKVFYFLVSPRTEQFVNDPALGGGSFINYTISLYQITGL